MKKFNYIKLFNGHIGKYFNTDSTINYILETHYFFHCDSKTYEKINCVSEDGITWIVLHP